MIASLLLSISLYQPHHGDITDVTIRVEYRGPATTWTVRLIPQSYIGGPVWFGDGDTVTVTGVREYWWLGSAYESSAIFSAELVSEGGI
jgi:hypothetical protein